MLSVQPFYTPNLCAFSIGLGAIACDNEHCQSVHGWSLHGQFMWWGIEIEYDMRS